MTHHRTLTIASLASIILFSLHWADEVARGIEPGTVRPSEGRMISSALSAHTLWDMQRSRSKRT